MKYGDGTGMDAGSVPTRDGLTGRDDTPQKPSAPYGGGGGDGSTGATPTGGNRTSPLGSK